MKFIQRHSKYIGLFRFGFYQTIDKIQFGISANWMERPLLICLDIFFWEFELEIYKSKKDQY